MSCWVFSVWWLVNLQHDALEHGLACIWLLTQLLSILILLTHALEVVTARARVGRTSKVLPSDVIHYPLVSIHVPIHREPVEVVKGTLDHLTHLDYPEYEVVVVDNNTPEPYLWKPVSAHCKSLGYKFFHLKKWPGYKAGALNFALTQTARDALLIAVVDADYNVTADFLKKLVGRFQHIDISYVQSPQDYREWKRSSYDRYCYYAYKYFDVSMMSRATRNSLIFAGTMGIVRRSVLDACGWDELCITEDAELGLRLAVDGHRAEFVNESFGHGLMPFDYESLKRQRHRWAFGGIQILLKYAWALFGAQKNRRRRKLTVFQRYDYTVGAVHWLEFIVAVAGTIVLGVTSLVWMCGGIFEERGAPAYFLECLC